VTIDICCQLFGGGGGKSVVLLVDSQVSPVRLSDKRSVEGKTLEWFEIVACVQKARSQLLQRRRLREEFAGSGCQSSQFMLTLTGSLLRFFMPYLA
jgi:hypothetical protein